MLAYNRHGAANVENIDTVHQQFSLNIELESI